ncbi:hypothetical protein WJ968_30390 [Achromobacter xylosoxidans]
MKVTLSGADAGFSLNGQAYAVIHDARQLQEMESNLTGRYVLGNDIDASDTRNWNQGSGFTGRPAGSQQLPRHPGGPGQCHRRPLHQARRVSTRLYIRQPGPVWRFKRHCPRS